MSESKDTGTAAERQRRAELAELLGRVEHAEHHVPAWLRPTSPENRLPVAAAILVAVVLQLLLPNRYGVHPSWYLPALEIVLLVILLAINPLRLERSTKYGRVASIALVAAITLDNALSAAVLDYNILTGQAGQDAIGLLASAAGIYATNVIAFGIWYWELDRGGPFDRTAGVKRYPDFLFPQMSEPHRAPPDWEPRFVDYLYVSFTNVAAFSPTDTLPFSRWAKALMAGQSVIALSTTVLVIARAVNVLR